jgi:hypothetical protein
MIVCFRKHIASLRMELVVYGKPAKDRASIAGHQFVSNL